MEDSAWFLPNTAPVPTSPDSLMIPKGDSLRSSYRLSSPTFAVAEPTASVDIFIAGSYNIAYRESYS
ncbi:MAG: hypothetical protein MZU97_12465 [Bacillus subtilis]|nr:hypothetical protein [Bacillus subtilis]